MKDKKIQNILQFYKLANKLKYIVRTGWKQWAVSSERVESVAEHIYSTIMLAIAVNSELGSKLPPIDIKKTIFMLAVHELREILVGDIGPYDPVNKKLLQKNEQQALTQILKPLAAKKEIEALLCEFEQGKTNEAKFARQIDKLDAGLQCKLYDTEGFIDASKIHPEDKQKFLESGPQNPSDYWLERCIKIHGFDDIFTQIAKEAKDDKNW